MKIAATVMSKHREPALELAQQWLDTCLQEKVDLVVFPALFGLLDAHLDFLEAARDWSRTYPQLAICPGSWWEEANGEHYHTSCLLHDGEVLLWQRQLYLAKWEQKKGLARGTKTAVTSWCGYRIGILLSTDIFYPQVARQLALKGADLILAPLALLNGGAEVLELAGMWQVAQQNGFFAIECGFKGRLFDKYFCSESIIHAPLDWTEQEDGWLARESSRSIVAAELNLFNRKQATAPFNSLAQLNPHFYRKHLFKRG